LREQRHPVGQVLREGVVERFAVFGKRPMRREERAAFHLAGDLPAVGAFHRDREGGAAQGRLVSPIGHDRVRLAGAKGEHVSVCSCELNLEFVVEFAPRWVHPPFADEGIVCGPCRARH
jgi:hypothetical protein